MEFETITDRDQMLDIVHLLSRVPYFSKVSKDDLEQYAKTASVKHVECGEILIREGETDDRIYIVMDGRLQASSVKVRKGKVVLGEIGKGEVVGETAALMQIPRGATVEALRKSLLLEITADELIDLVKQDSETLRLFSKNLLQRSRSNFAHQQNYNSVLLFPLQATLDLTDFARSLEKELQKFTPVFIASPSEFEGKLDLENPKPLAAEFVDQESKHPMVVYLSDGKWDTWTQVAAQRCDNILMVASADAEKEIGPAERQLWDTLDNSNHAHIELALLHPSTAQAPRHTSQWFEGRSIKRHYHIARNEEKHFQKLARFLTGNAIGYALSGGGFKAAMQVGVLHALEEAGIPFDILGGSSGGAMASAFFASRPDLDTVSEKVLNALLRFKKASKLTPPFVSLFTGKHLTHGFQHFLGDADIEDLWRSFFCTSLNLVDGSIKAHQRGPLWEAVRASSAVMALFPPVLKDGECLVDGGFVNPCPTDILHQMGVGKVVVISAFESGGVKLDAHFPPETSGWRILKHKLNPFSKRKFAPSLGSNIIQSMMFASEHLLQKTFSGSDIDLLIEPDLSQYSSQDRSSVKVFYEIGYNYGRNHAAEWKEILLP